LTSTAKLNQANNLLDKRGPTGPLFIAYIPLDIGMILTYNMNMNSDNILVEFTSFIEKSAVVMLQPPAAAAIAAPNPPAPAADENRSPSLVSPTISAQPTPRTAAMPQGNTAPAATAPKPITNTNKPMKQTNFNPASKK
jgi:hypothetical protein